MPNEGALTRAAEELLISQPALSRSIQKLEEELGQPVFERQAREVLLTDAGRTLQSRATQILALVEDAFAEITDNGRSGRFVSARFQPLLLIFFRNCFEASLASPACPRHRPEEVTERLLHRIQQGELDVVILAAPIVKQYLEIEELFEEELFLVMSSDHELSKKRTLRIDDMHGVPFVMLEEAHCLSGNIFSFCRERLVQPVSVERTSQLATVQELVTLGHGVSLIPAMARAVDSSKKRVYRSFSGDRPHRTICMVTNPYRFQSRLVKEFLDHLRQRA